MPEATDPSEYRTWTLPGANPSADYIVTQTVYIDNSPSGPIVDTINNAGVDTRTISDLAGRKGRKEGRKGRVAPGDCSPGAPTDPYVRNYRIRFLK